MRRYLLLLTSAFLFCTIVVQAQIQNALAFDGIDDYVNVPSGSGYVTGAAEMSITCWAYPTNSSPAYPNFDGFAGFRNDIDADFYLVQIGANQLEGRFRNSAGTMFTITSNILTLNTWNHIAMTYGNGWLKLYKNGYITDSIAANGTIQNGNVDFIIGKVVFTNADFLLTGRMDETSLWSRELSAAEIVCMPSEGIDSSASGLELLYNFNQGAAGGTNIGITSLIDQTGTANGNLNNFTLSGSVSNFVQGASLVSVTVGFTCPEVPYTWNGQQYTLGGTYTDTLVSAAGCDSIVRLQLSLLSVDTVVNVNWSTLTANLVGGIYQWVDCNNNYAIIPGATSRSFTPTIDGSYAAIITQNTCIDTSACITLVNVGLDENDKLAGVHLQPTFTSSTTTLYFEKTESDLEISVHDISGKVIVDRFVSDSGEEVIDLSNVPAGVYFLRAARQNQTRVFRIMRL